MNRYETLEQYKNIRKPVYLPFVLLGYPRPAITEEACRVMIEEGVHGLELGLPFRDPVADGPTIQAAANEVLDQGFKINDAVELIAKIRSLDHKIPLTLMSYYNMVFSRGPDRFIGELAEAGLDGILVPDMPPERADELLPITEKHGLKLIFIAAPNTQDHRLNLIRQYAGGFCYVVTRMGVTGTHEDYAVQLPNLFSRIKQNINLPALAGFGISEPEQAIRMIKAGADGVIVGSKLVELIKEGTHVNNFNSTHLRNHTRRMVEALSSFKE
jgi:tryptophan synthase alpha chain